MKCPSCNHAYRLTWAEYFKEPRGHHTCPECHERFRLRYSVRYLVLTTLGCVVGAIPPAELASLHVGTLLSTVFGAITGALITGLPIDKMLDDRFRAAVVTRKEPT